MISIRAFVGLIIMACAAQRVSAEVRLSGVSEAEAKRVRREVPAAFAEKVNYETVDDLVRNLSASGLYERVSAQAMDNGDILLVARTLRTIRQVIVKGQRSFSDGRLREVLAIAPGDRFERKRVLEAGERLKQFYGEHGYFNTVIEVSFAKEVSNGLVIEFRIDEKPPCIVAGVNVESSNTTIKERIKRTAQRYFKKPLSSEVVDSIKKRATDLFLGDRFLKAELSDPEISYNADKSSAVLTYHISEPFRYEFSIDGHTFLNTSEAYRIMGLDALDRQTLDPAAEAADRLRQHYLKQGFPNVDVSFKTTEIEAAFLRRIFIQIKENQRVRIRDFHITGRVTRPSSYYSDFITHNSSDLVRRGYYNRQDLEKGFENLLNELRNQGFLRAKIQSSRLEYSNHESEARVVLIMDEGPLTQVRGLRFEGATAFSAAELAAAIPVKADAPLRLKDLEKSIEDIKSFYRDRGYLEMRLLNETEDLIEYNEKGTQAQVKFQIFEGPKVIVSSIALEGNSFTKGDVILRTIEFKVGDILTPSKIDESEILLNRMGIFSRVNIHTLEDGTNVSNRTVIVSVTERDPATFRLGAGVNTERDLTVRGFTGLSYNNLFGTARAVTSRFELKSHVREANYPQTEVALGFLEPFLFDNRTSGRVNLTRAERVFEFNKASDLTKITTSNKLDFLLDHYLTRNWRITWKVWSMDSRKEWERHGQCYDPTAPNSTICTVQQIATMGPMIDVDYRDNPFLPTKGSYSTWSLDYSDPYFGSSSLINFVRTEAGHTRYFQLPARKVVWANSVRSGYVRNLSGRQGSGVPTSHAFLLGGFGTIRGFGGSSENERIPPGYELPVSLGNQLLIAKDSYYGLIKSELRFPLFGDHGGVFFYDGGLVQVTGHDFSRPYRDSIGLGYRYNTPVGPFSLDYACKIRPRLEERHREEKCRFQLSFGTF